MEAIAKSFILVLLLSLISKGKSSNVVFLRIDLLRHPECISNDLNLRQLLYNKILAYATNVYNDAP